MPDGKLIKHIYLNLHNLHPYKKFIYGNDTFCVRFVYVFMNSVSQFHIFYKESVFANLF